MVGLIAGWLASQVMRGGGYGLIGDIMVGIVGAVIGGFLAATFLHMPSAVNGINVTSILVAFVGAVILIADSDHLEATQCDLTGKRGAKRRSQFAITQ